MDVPSFVGMGLGIAAAVAVVLAVDRFMTWLIPCRLPDHTPELVRVTPEWWVNSMGQQKH